MKVLTSGLGTQVTAAEQMLNATFSEVMAAHTNIDILFSQAQHLEA